MSFVKGAAVPGLAMVATMSTNLNGVAGCFGVDDSQGKIDTNQTIKMRKIGLQR